MTAGSSAEDRRPGVDSSAPGLSCPWEEQYRRGEMRWDKGEAAPGLVDFLAAHPELRRGRVLVPGCGTGHDVRVWAAAGWTVTGLDIAPTAITLARECTTAAGLRAEWRQADFLTETPGDPFDWVFEHTLYCALEPSRRPAYVQAVQRWLVPGGSFLAIHYLNPQDPDGPPWGVARDDLLAQFGPAFDLIEEWVPRSYPNRTGRELMLRWRKR